MNTQVQTSSPLETRAEPDLTGDIAEAVRTTIYRATIALDDREWSAWLALCHEKFVYAIKSWSPEIRRDMTYQHCSREDLVSLIDLLPKHNTDHSPLTRHTTVYTVDVDADGLSATSVSAFVVFQHLLDGMNSHIDAGESRLFLVGKYYDTFTIENGQALFTERVTRLENRRLDRGSHWPI